MWIFIFEFNIKSREQSNQPTKKECCKQSWNVFNLQLLQCIVSLICDYRWEMYLYRDKKDDFAFNKYPIIHHNTVPFKTCMYCIVSLILTKGIRMKNDTKTTHINWFLKWSSTKHLKTHTKNQSSLFVIGY